eukprot:SRR837773.10922.p1 GENE.SRR837773.10922~~SRR837773.10922.p1  ORF type:complete len:411 (-),score=62.73 SRR837773.10922:105-1337(-)
MVDVWWGLCEPSPGKYSFEGYLQLAKICKEIGLKLQAVMSFHQCGGNVGDSVSVPIPSWALNPARERGLLYQDHAGKMSEDCLSLSADNEQMFPGQNGQGKRSALRCYHDYMVAFAEEFAQYLGNTVVEIQVGMGPCGELRYPSYMMSQGWNYPGVGLIMAYDSGMTKMLKEAASAAGKAKFGTVPTSAPKNTNGMPDDTPLFASGGSGEEHRTGAHGAFFLKWYHETLLRHGQAVLGEACKAFPKMKDLVFSVKVSGIHWHCMHPSRAAETCAGYSPNPETGVGAYDGIARMLSTVAKESGRDVFFNFTCLEMSNQSQGPGMPQATSAPEDLIAEVRRACVQHKVHLCGENALQFGLPESAWALNQIATQTRGWASGHDKMHAVTLLRLDEGFARPSSFKTLRRWIASL